MNRIETIYSYIDENDKVVDVGCDQAKLSIMLSQRNQSSIAVDISEKVIEKAKRNIKSDLIDLRVSNGLENVNSNEVDTLVLSGMGTHTILEIISKSNIKFKKIITISNNYHSILREKMNDLGYKIELEEIIKEKNKYYNLILFIRGNNNLTEEEILLGKNHVNKELYNEYLNYLLKKYSKIKETSKDKNNNIDKLINSINKILELE